MSTCALVYINQDRIAFPDSMKLDVFGAPLSVNFLRARHFPRYIAPMSGAIRIPDGFVDELKARIRPSEVIGRKVKLKKQGKEWVGLSPFTNEKTPSFYDNDQKKIFKCFSSGMGGDVISFVMETERLSFMEAVEKLADEAGMSLPKATPESQEQ